MTVFSPHPRVRILGGAIALFATFWTPSLAVLAVAAGLVLAFTAALGIGPQFRGFLIKFFLPLAAGLLIVWGGVMGAPPGFPIASDRSAGAVYAGTIALRLLVASGIVQISILAVPQGDLPRLFSACGLKGDLLASVIAAFALFPELELRTRQVLTARYARGLSRRRTPWSLIAQLPLLLRPVLAWTLRSAIQRSEQWSQRDPSSTP